MTRQYLKSLISEEVRKQFQISPEFTVEASSSQEHGDYFTNAALFLAKTVSGDPGEIAEKITAGLKEKLADWQIEIVKPGFINFRMSGDYLQKKFEKVVKEGENYGRGKKQKIKLQIEYVSANPTGPLTLANGRGGFLGDVLSNVLEFAGHEAEREYYVNDTGNQILILGKSILAEAGLAEREESFYKGGYVKKWAGSNKQKVKNFKKEPLKLGQKAARDFMTGIKKTLKRAGVDFDRFTSEEKNIHKKNLIKKAFCVLQKSGKVYRQDGAVWLKTTDFGDDKDRVLLTSDGFPTYFLADAGHYLETKIRGFGVKINILGPDHFGYVKRIQAAAELLGFKNSKIIVTQAVRLIREGKEIKMSKRKGEFVAFEDLLEEVGRDAARFFFLEKSSDTHIDFNLGLAKEKSVKNPVYYIQYAHARASSIFRKARDIKRKLKYKKQNINLFKTTEELALIKKLIQFPEIVEDIVKDYQVHRLPRFSLELARIFHNFYEKHRVITDDSLLTQARLSLVLATKTVFKKTLELMGVTAPEKM